MKRLTIIVLVIGLSSLRVWAPEKISYWDTPQYLTSDRNMRFTIYPENYHARKIEEILNSEKTIK